MKDSATWLWARSIVRRNMRSTVFLIVFVGVAAAAAMTAWEFSRRAETVIDRRLDHVFPADGSLSTCPPGVDPGIDLTLCFGVDSNEIAYQALIASPAVAAASLVAGSQFAISTTRDGLPLVTFGGGTVQRLGRIGEPVIVSGQAGSDDAADEIVLAESTARRLGIDADATVWVAGCTFDFGQSESICGEPVQVRVAGIARTERDLLPARRQPPGLDDREDSDFGLSAGIAWSESFGRQYAVFVQLTFRLAPSATLDDVRADVQAGLPEGWTVLVVPTEDSTTFNGLGQSTRLQADALLAVAAILAVAGAVFCAQALTRQSRREMADRGVSKSLGMTRRDLATVALLRSAPIAAGSATIAVVGAAIASGFGPTSLAGRAEVDPGIRIDLPVLVLGAVATLVLVVTVCVFVSVRTTTPMRREPVRFLPTGVTTYAPPTAVAGLALARSPRTGGGGSRTVVLSAAAAIVGVITAGILADGLDAVLAEPREFGSAWQYSFTDFAGGGQSMEDAIERFTTDPLLTDVTFVSSSGPLSLPSVSEFWVLSFTSIKGDLGPVIVEGRAPIADDEVAVGIATLEALGKKVGDVIDGLPIVTSGGAATESETGTLGPLTIVGVALISDDTVGVGPGSGIILTESARLQIDPAAFPVVLVRTDPSVTDVETATRLQDSYGQVTVPSPQSDISNLSLISGTPWLIALLVAALAAGALGHSLISVVRRNRRDIGVLRALGFTRRQVSACVSWHASRIAVLAIALGVPLGIIGGRWAWSTLANSVGLALDPVVGVVVPLVAAGATFVAANVVTAIPTRQARQHDLANSLRDE
ncbi:MAG: ABC transporter permease [Actinomycetia bacterium]|nr:ABC transporter permease [Actinomycetes bacterium]